MSSIGTHAAVRWGDNPANSQPRSGGAFFALHSSELLPGAIWQTPGCRVPHSQADAACRVSGRGTAAFRQRSVLCKTASTDQTAVELETWTDSADKFAPPSSAQSGAASASHNFGDCGALVSRADERGSNYVFIFILTRSCATI